jgi:hypothetical protein
MNSPRSTIAALIPRCFAFLFASAALLLGLAPATALAQVSVLGTPATSIEVSGSQFSKTMAFTVPAGNNRLLVVTTGGSANAATVTSVTFGGTPLTQGVTTAIGTTRSSIFFLVLGSSGTANTANVIVNYSSNFLFDVTAIAFQGVDQTTPVSGAVSGNAQSLSVVSAVNDFVIDAIVGFGSGVAVGGGQTLRANNNNLIFGGDPDTGTSTKPGAASVAMDWTGFISGIAHVALNVRQVATPVSITTASLIGASVGSIYLDTLSATGGTGAKSFTVTAGALLTGVTLQSGGTLTGTPTASGIFTFTVTATDTVAVTATKAFTITIVGPPTVTTPTSATITTTTATLGGNVTADGSATLLARGVVYALTSANSNPAFGGTGVTSLAGSGTATGVFTVNVTGLTAGAAYSFRAYATNSAGIGYSTAGTFTTATAAAPIVVSPTTLTNAVAGIAQNQTLAATGGTGTKTFAVTSGTLPTGLTLSSVGALTGTPTAAGTFNFTVTATDTVSATGAQA